LVEDVGWICSRADVVEDARNDALHSPLWAYERGPFGIVVMPIVGFGHVRARKLFEKNLLVEFRWCRDAAVALSIYARAINESLSDPMRPWPDRPSWPNRGRTKKLSPYHARSAAHPRRPRSSLP
jgi:hypothetical protein